MQTPPQAGDPSSPPAAPSFPETSPHEPQVRPWELELLISGAVVFSLLQLPGWVDGQYARARMNVDRGTFLGSLMLYVYIKVSLYTLIICFLTHLAARGYWVGLIGLESVYPRGVNWSNTNHGPVMTEVYRERLGRIQAHIDAADRFCSILFPVAFSLVSMCAYSLGLMALLSGVAYGGTLAAGRPDAFAVAFVITVVAYSLVPTVMWMLDRRMGAAAQPGSALHRRLRKMAVVVFYMSAMPAVGVMFTTLYSNSRRSLRYPLLVVGIAALFVYVFAHDVMVSEGLLRMGGTAYYPDDAGELELEPAFYADQRSSGEMNDRAPFIQSEVIRGPYVRLFIPYVPLLHGESLAEACPGLPVLNRGGVRLGRAESPDAEQMRALLACWTRVQPVVLNGRRISPEFHFATDQLTGLRGIVAQIPVRGLPAGQNMLRVSAPPRTAESRRRRPTEPDPAVIWFWL